MEYLAREGFIDTAREMDEWPRSVWRRSEASLRDLVITTIITTTTTTTTTKYYYYYYYYC